MYARSLGPSILLLLPSSSQEITYLAVENKMKGEESEKACADAHKPVIAAVTERRIVFIGNFSFP